MNLQNIRFDGATPDDFEWYYALRKKTMYEHFVNAGKGWPEETEHIRHREHYTPETLRIICLGDARIGCINVARTTEELHISALCIEPEYQNRGCGTQVLQHILNEPEHRKLPCTLDVLVDNPSYRLYQRLGFIKVTGELPILAYYARPAQTQSLVSLKPFPEP